MKSSKIFALLAACIVFAGGGVDLLGQTCDNTNWSQQQQFIGIQTGQRGALKPLHIDAFVTNCQDPSIRLSYSDETERLYWGHLSLLTPGNLGQYSLVPEATASDLILHSDASAEDIILTTRSDLGHLRFCTTPELMAPDMERMTVTPFGRVGISNNEPKNLFSTKTTTGLDFWNDNIEFQDIRFNCYADSEWSAKDGSKDSASKEIGDQLYHKNIQPGHAAIIQHISKIGSGSLLLQVSQKYTSSDSRVEFFETFGGHPKGILLQNHQVPDSVINNVTNIGLGSLTEANTRVRILGRTSDNTMYALKIVDWDEEPIVRVRNDGDITVGEFEYSGTLPPQFSYRFSVDGQIVAKDIIVTLTDWADFVFEDSYELETIQEVEQYIKKNKHLSGMPTTEEVKNKGVNLGEMQVKLLQKVEELTLYLIQLKKENEELNQRLKEIESK